MIKNSQVFFDVAIYVAWRCKTKEPIRSSTNRWKVKGKFFWKILHVLSCDSQWGQRWNVKWASQTSRGESSILWAVLNQLDPIHMFTQYTWHGKFSFCNNCNNFWGEKHTKKCGTEEKSKYNFFLLSHFFLWPHGMHVNKCGTEPVNECTTVIKQLSN